MARDPGSDEAQRQRTQDQASYHKFVTPGFHRFAWARPGQ